MTFPPFRSYLVTLFFLSLIPVTLSYVLPPVSDVGPVSIASEESLSIAIVSPQSTAATIDSDPDDRNPTETANDSGIAVVCHSSSDLAVPTDCFQQMKRKAKATITVLSSLIAYVSINSLVRAVNPSAFIWSHEDKDEDHWISTSNSWLDRKACRWLSICGASHFKPASGRFGHRGPSAPQVDDLWRSFWPSAQNTSNNWDAVERSRREIPDYVFEYAPLVHLFSGEQFWPCDIAEHLFHTTPMLNYTPIQSQSKHETLDSLDQLNQWQEGWNVFLTSNNNVENRPRWMEGEKNIPELNETDTEEAWADWDDRVDGEIPGDTPGERAEWYDAGDPSRWGKPAGPANLQPEDVLPDDDPIREELRKRYGGLPLRRESTTGGRSDAPAILLVMDKGNGIVDAFWFYFYSFNLGNVVFNVRFGNHVGDWEHCLVRFHHGKPKALFFSAHSAGEAYSYEAIEKIGRRVSRIAHMRNLILTNPFITASHLFRRRQPCNVSHPGDPRLYLAMGPAP